MTNWLSPEGWIILILVIYGLGATYLAIVFYDRLIPERQANKYLLGRNEQLSHELQEERDKAAGWADYKRKGEPQIEEETR